MPCWAWPPKALPEEFPRFGTLTIDKDPHSIFHVSFLRRAKQMQREQTTAAAGPGLGLAPALLKRPRLQI